jgi:alkylated DNA nucleotide flippase Atl1
MASMRARRPLGNEYRDAVLAVVAAIPAGRVMSYSGIADYLAEAWRMRAPRRVGQVMASSGSTVPWHRVVQASGRPVRGLEVEAMRRLRAEATPLTARGDRVDMRHAAWAPDRPAPGPPATRILPADDASPAG